MCSSESNLIRQAGTPLTYETWLFSRQLRHLIGLSERDPETQEGYSGDAFPRDTNPEELR